MRIERKKNALRGTVTGIIVQSFNMLIPFIIRSIFIRIIGIEYAGLDSLFKSILQVLNLTELGVGSAIVFSMYKPISVGDDIKICALMKLYKLYYRVIGLVILLIGVLLTPFLQMLIDGTVPSDVNLYVLYYLNLGATVLSYWLFSYRSAVLNAHQRVDVINISTFIVGMVKYSLQIVFLFVLKNYYVYLIINLIFQLVLNITIAIVSKKIFPAYLPKGNISKEEKKSINLMMRDLLTAKIGGVVLTSVDTLVISSFLGLEVLAIYNNYFYVMSALFAFFMVFYNACRAGIANELIVESEDKKIKDFNNLTFVVCFFLNICVACLLNIFQPFMKLWIGSNYLLSSGTIIWLCVYFVSYEIPVFWSMYKDAGGAWKQDRFRPLIGAIVNLVFNILLVRVIGLNGVIISTVISEIFICIPWLLFTLKRNVLDLQINEVLRKVTLYLLCTTVSAVITYYLCKGFCLEGVIGLVLRFVLSVFVSSLIWFAFFFKTEEYRTSLNILKKDFIRSI